MKLFVNLLVLSFLCFYAESTLARPPAPWEIEGLIGKPAPAFTLSDIAGKEINLDALSGKVVLLNFWATWCAPCRAEMPDLDKLATKFKNQGLIVLGVSVDLDSKRIRSFLKKRPVGFPIAQDNNLEISGKYKTFAYPTSFLIDRQGVVREKYIGQRDWLGTEMQKMFKGYISK